MKQKQRNIRTEDLNTLCLGSLGYVFFYVNSHMLESMILSFLTILPESSKSPPWKGFHV